MGLYDGPDWLDEQTRDRVLELFRLFGVTGEISLLRTEERDEAGFVVSPTGAERMDETPLTIELQALLRRKVWVLTDATGWNQPIDLIGVVPH